MFPISVGSTCDIDAVKTRNTDLDDEDSKIARKKQRKVTVMTWAGVELETVGQLPEALMT